MQNLRKIEMKTYTAFTQIITNNNNNNSKIIIDYLQKF